MSMTIEEAIKHFSQQVSDKSVLSVARGMDNPRVLSVVERIYEANELALVALKEKAERENTEPLTLEELWLKDGHPVWIVWPDKRIESKWWIPGSYDWNMMEFNDHFMERRYGQTWIAYRHEPKEDQK